MGVANIVDVMRSVIPRLVFDLEPDHFAVEAPQGNPLRDGVPVHVGPEGQEPLRLFHVIAQPDPRHSFFNGELAEYEQTVEVQMRYCVPPNGNALPQDLDGVTRAYALAGEDASNISHSFESDFGWGGAAELTNFTQVSTSRTQALGCRGYLLTIEFDAGYTSLKRTWLIP